MDILKIRTYVGRKVLSAVLSKFLSKKLGCNVSIWFDSLEMTNSDDSDTKIIFSGKATLPLDKVFDN